MLLPPDGWFQLRLKGRQEVVKVHDDVNETVDDSDHRRRTPRQPFCSHITRTRNCYVMIAMKERKLSVFLFQDDENLRNILAIIATWNDENKKNFQPYRRSQKASLESKRKPDAVPSVHARCCCNRQVGRKSCICTSITDSKLPKNICKHLIPIHFDFSYLGAEISVHNNLEEVVHRHQWVQLEWFSVFHELRTQQE